METSVNMIVFQLTTSLRRPTKEYKDDYIQPEISTHDLLAEADVRVDIIFSCFFISTHDLLAEADKILSKWQGSADISTHDLLAEADLSDRSGHFRMLISTHDLLAEADCSTPSCVTNQWSFQLTTSLRRPTIRLWK